MLLAAGCLTLVAPAVARADVIGQWNAIAQAETRPAQADRARRRLRGIAMVQGAVYDAVNAIDRSRKPYLLDPDEVGAQPAAPRTPPPPRPRTACSWRSRPEARHAGLDTAYAATLARVPDGPAGRAGSVPVRQPRRRCSPHGRTTDSWRRSRRSSAPRPATGGRSGGRRLRSRPRRLGRQPEAVPDQEPVAVPNEGPERAHERRLRRGLRRGEVARSAHQHDANGRPDSRRRLLAVRSDRPLEPAPAGSRRPLQARHRQRSPALRHREPGGSRRGDRAAGTTSTTGSFWRPRAAIREADSDGNPATSPTRPGSRCSRRRRRRPRRSPPRRSPTTRRATAA